jgi:hypothetical protein
MRGKEHYGAGALGPPVPWLAMIVDAGGGGPALVIDLL